MYDPLGPISPIVLEVMRIFQEASRLKLSWDEPLPHDVAQRWFAWLTSLSYLPEIHFQRCIIPAGFADAVAELHHFCDGSQVGFGACSYVRLVSPSGNNHVALVTAKSRLAPLKQVSIPRLELSAAVLSVELDTLLRRELDVHLIVRSYIHNESKHYKVFVANRISLIRQHSEPAQWLHVDGTQNPADVVSRGCNADNLPLIWFSGPPFLGLLKSEWPMACQSDLKIPEDDPEVCSSQMLSSQCCIASVVPSSHPLELLCGYYSSYYRLKKAVCWLLWLKFRLMKRTPPTGPITVAEMSAAEKMVLNYVQCQMFWAELTSLRSCGRVHRSSPIFKLCPRMFDGILVVGGRLKHASILSGIKNPIILPRDHHVSLMIVQEYHENTHLKWNGCWAEEGASSGSWMLAIWWNEWSAHAWHVNVCTQLPWIRRWPTCRQKDVCRMWDHSHTLVWISSGRSTSKSVDHKWTGTAVCLPVSAPEQFILKCPSVSILIHLSTHLSDLLPEEAPLRRFGQTTGRIL